jgi:hypothetical protein
MVENIQVGDWVVDYAGDYGMVVRIDPFSDGLEPNKFDTIVSNNWRFFPNKSYGLGTHRDKIQFVFKTEYQAKVIADILTQHCDDADCDKSDDEEDDDDNM